MLPKGPRWPGLLMGCLGGFRAIKKENYRVTYGFTELRGKPAGRGRDGRASRNQVVAGTTTAATTTVATISTATVYQLSPPGSHRVYAVGPGGLSYVPMKLTILKSPPSLSPYALYDENSAVFCVLMIHRDPLEQSCCAWLLQRV